MAEFKNFWWISSLKCQITKVAKTKASAMASATATSIAIFCKIAFFGQNSCFLAQIHRWNSISFNHLHFRQGN